MTKELAQLLAQECHFVDVLGKDEPLDLQRVSLCFEATQGRSVLVQRLKTYLRDNKEPSPALLMLAAMPFRIFVTTNYDPLLDRALREIRPPKQAVGFIYSPDNDKPTPDMTEDPTPERPMLFKMHGDFDREDSIVATDENYITFIQRMSDKDAVHPLPETLRFRLQKWPTLFVGYSLKDYNLRLLFRTLRWRLDPAKFPRSYSLDPNPDPLILQLWQNRTEVITFLIQDLWAFVPWLYKEVMGKEYSYETESPSGDTRKAA
jgi:hypothetical protein